MWVSLGKGVIRARQGLASGEKHRWGGRAVDWRQMFFCPASPEDTWPHCPLWSLTSAVISICKRKKRNEKKKRKEGWIVFFFFSICVEKFLLFLFKLLTQRNQRNSILISVLNGCFDQNRNGVANNLMGISFPFYNLTYSLLTNISSSLNTDK